MTVTLAIPQSSSNKTGDKAKLLIHRLAYDVEVPDKGKQKRTIYVLKPFIDKLSFRCHLPAKDDREGIGPHLGDLMSDGDYPQFQQAPAKVIYTSRYKTNVVYKVANAPTEVLIQAVPKSKNYVTFMRFEFNPAKLGKNGLHELNDMVKTVFAYHHDLSWLMANARGLTFDIACDMLNVAIDELIFQSKKPGKSHAYHGVSGRPETIYVGLKSGKSSALKAYNKKQELQDAGLPTQFAQMPHTRIEATVATKYRVHQLGLLKNPFKKIRASCPSADLAPEKDYVWQLFLDSCRLRGFAGALKRVPEASRPSYAAALGAAKRVVWDPEKIWTFWPEALAYAGLVSKTVKE